MVLFALALLGAGALAFFSAGGIKKVKAFAEARPTTSELADGTATTPSLESGVGSVPIASGSQRTTESIQQEDITRLAVADKRKFSPHAGKDPIKTVFNNPKQGGNLDTQTGQIVGANLSVEKGQQFGTGQFGLTTKEISEIRSKDFTEQEKQDISRLKLRFDRKSVSAQKVSDSPEELIFKKREQEAIAKKVLEAELGEGSFRTNISEEAFEDFPFLTGGKPPQAKLFAKPNFVFGGVSEKEFRQQRKEKAEEFARIQEVGRQQKERTERGEAIDRSITASGQTQREFLMSRGIALRGSPLNARALAKLQERGLI